MLVLLNVQFSGTLVSWDVDMGFWKTFSRVYTCTCRLIALPVILQMYMHFSLDSKVIELPFIPDSKSLNITQHRIPNRESLKIIMHI